MSKLVKLRFRLGVKLLTWGSRLALYNDDNCNQLKDAINRNTLIGSYSESGGHLTGYIQPMCDYSTQSVVNVLRSGLLVESDSAFNGTSPTEKQGYYKETWKY